MSSILASHSISSKSEKSSLARNHSEKTSPLGLVIVSLTVVAMAGLLVWQFRNTLFLLPTIWQKDAATSHGWFILPLSVWFAVLASRRSSFRWNVHEEDSLQDCIAGSIRILVGCFIHYGCLITHTGFFDLLALLLIVSGITIMLIGKEKYRPFSFPLFFLMFASPWPSLVIDRLAIAMQQAASWSGATLLDMMGIDVYREGYRIMMPGFVMEVGAACSGLRQITAIFALSLAMGYLTRQSRSKMILLALLAVPIAIGANVIRILMTGLILLFFGQKWAEGVYHSLEGMAIYAIAALLLWFVFWLIEKNSYAANE